MSTEIRIGSQPFGAVVTPDGRRAYVTSLAMDTSIVLVIDTATNAVIATIPVGGGAGRVSMAPDGRMVFVAGSGGAGGVSVTPDGRRVYAAGKNNVSVIDTATECSDRHDFCRGVSDWRWGNPGW